MQSKRDIRQLMLERREALDAGEIKRSTKLIENQLYAFRNKIIGTHIPIRNEIDALTIAKHLSPEICFPCIENEKDRVLTFRKHEEGHILIQGKHQISCPAPTAPQCIPEVLFVPLLAFDPQGYRLGYGGGYYDTTITAMKQRNIKTQAIGLAYDFQQVDRLPVEAHDVKLDAIITPNKYIIVT